LCVHFSGYQRTYHFSRSDDSACKGNIHGERKPEIDANLHIFYNQNADQGKPQPTSYPRLKIRTGQKFIVEDGNTSQSQGNGVKLLKQIINLVKCKLFRLIPTEMSIPHLSAGKQEVNKI
jgi:hypothetical protein